MTSIGEEIGEVIATLRDEEDGAPFYMYGHRRELAMRLTQKNKDVTDKNKKFPLIILILDVPENQTDDVLTANLHLAFITYVKGEKNAEQRITQTIDPSLYPLYKSFMEALVDSGKFTWPGDPTNPTHIKYNRPRWGLPGNEGNEAKYFDEDVDAIEVVNLELNRFVCDDDSNESEQDVANDVIVITAQDKIYTGE